MAAAMIGLLGKAQPKLAADVLAAFRHKRHMAMLLRRFNRALLVSDDDLRSIARCGNSLGGDVMITRSPDGRVRPSGMATCKSVWGCLGCAARRRAMKSAEVKFYVDAHLATGGGVSFASLTLAHYAGDSLAELLTGLKDAFTAMRNLKVYKDAEAEYGIVGWIAALEITHGPNGWHPHLHVLFFHREHLPVEYGENAGLRAALYEAFARQIDRHLGRPVHQTYGVDLVPVKTDAGGDEAIARYLGKIQLEMTRQDLKTSRRSRHRSPWEIGLDAAQTGETRDMARWCEYLRATKGRNVVTKAASLIDRYGEPTEADIDRLLGGEHDDDQADDTDTGTTDIASIAKDVWNDALRVLTPSGSTAAEAALLAFENEDPELAAAHLSEALQPVVIRAHSTTGLPHLAYVDPPDRRSGLEKRRWRRAPGRSAIDPASLGPVAKAWFGAARNESKQKGDVQCL